MKTTATPPSWEERRALRRRWSPEDGLGSDRVWLETEDGLLLRPGASPAAAFPARPVPELGAMLLAQEKRIPLATPRGVELLWSEGGTPARALAQIVPVREFVSSAHEIAVPSTLEDGSGFPRVWWVARVLGTLRHGRPDSLERWLHLFYTTILYTEYAPLTTWEGRWPVFATQP